MVKYTQTIRRQQLMNCLSVFDHFVGLALKRLNNLTLTTITNNTLFWKTMFPSFTLKNWF